MATIITITFNPALDKSVTVPELFSEKKLKCSQAGGGGIKAIVEVSQPSVKVKSTVGAGDSLVAGIVYGLSQHYGLPDAVRFGVACGSAATMNPGTELCNKMDAERIYAALRQVATTETMKLS